MLLELITTLACALPLVVLGAVAAKLISCQLARVRFKKLTRGLPILPDAKLLGNHAYEVFLGERIPQKLLKWHQEMGKTIGWLRGTDFCVSTVDLKFMKTFIQDEPSGHLSRMRFNLPIRETEYNILTAPADEWQQMRRVIAPALT